MVEGTQLDCEVQWAREVWTPSISWTSYSGLILVLLCHTPSKESCFSFSVTHAECNEDAVTANIIQKLKSFAKGKSIFKQIKFWCLCGKVIIKIFTPHSFVTYVHYELLKTCSEERRLTACHPCKQARTDSPLKLIRNTECPLQLPLTQPWHLKT